LLEFLANVPRLLRLGLEVALFLGGFVEQVQVGIWLSPELPVPKIEAGCEQQHEYDDPIPRSHRQQWSQVGLQRRMGHMFVQELVHDGDDDKKGVSS
jgi:hypothetical protein